MTTIPLNMNILFSSFILDVFHPSVFPGILCGSWSVHFSTHIDCKSVLCRML